MHSINGILFQLFSHHFWYHRASSSPSSSPQSSSPQSSSSRSSPQLRPPAKHPRAVKRAKYIGLQGNYLVKTEFYLLIIFILFVSQLFKNISINTNRTSQTCTYNIIVIIPLICVLCFTNIFNSITTTNDAMILRARDAGISPSLGFCVLVFSFFCCCYCHLVLLVRGGSTTTILTTTTPQCTSQPKICNPVSSIRM